MSIIDTLIVDRTQADVEEVRRIRNKILSGGLSSLTSAERTAWLGGMKASYNYMDLNRVGEAVNFLRDELAELAVIVDVTGKTDWTVTDTPTQEQMTTYLQNIEKLRAAFPVTTENTPDTMRWLTIEKMNAIEKILKDVETVVKNIMNGWFACGELCCGES
jgi:hypothetical protein